MMNTYEIIMLLLLLLLVVVVVVVDVVIDVQKPTLCFYTNQIKCPKAHYLLITFIRA